MSKKVPSKLTAIIADNDEGSFTAYCPEIHGAISEGKTEDEAFANLMDAAEGLIAMRAELELEKKQWKRVKHAASQPLIPAWA